MIIKVKSRVAEDEDIEGEGGADGVVLPLHVVTSGVYDIAYTVQVKFGSSGQSLYLQVDTGSSDLWVASKACSSSPCRQTKNHLYDPNGSTSTKKDFTINYLQGKVSGPVVWDKLSIGNYAIDNQAFAAADSVTDEALSPLFSGILGLALPLDSVIASLITPVTSNSPDGAAWTSNLFSITPSSSVPSARFISLLLSRPGSDTVPAQLGIGRHPTYVRDPTRVQYTVLQSEMVGTLFWKVAVKAISVWAGGKELSIQIGKSNTGAVYPNAVIDSGVPLILTTRALADNIYGAIGVQSSPDDGKYYVPCTTPLNMSITLPSLSPIPLHPLDLTAYPSNDNKALNCVGLIQAADGVLAQPPANADIILGVPFLRNAYTVMAYEPPNSSGNFTSSSSTSLDDDVRPRLGLLAITDPTTALDEFNTVRVLKQPISSNSESGSGSNSGSSGDTGRHMATWAIALISVLGVLLLCAGVFGVRWWLARRNKKHNSVSETSGGGGVLASLGRATAYDDAYAYALTSTGESSRARSRAPEGRNSLDGEETVKGGMHVGKHDQGKEEHHSNRGIDEMGYRLRIGHKFTPSDGVPLLHETDLEPVWSVSDLTSSPRQRVYDEFGASTKHGAENTNSHNRAIMVGVGTFASSGKFERWGDEDRTLVSKGVKG
ncbi:hypothetical protein H0H87_005573 [Tephrocybe sp. NHM501043]|nr:hypothetical protein H0H87_005573 [Tephrocybe sp. NHM501043]